MKKLFLPLIYISSMCFGLNGCNRNADNYNGNNGITKNTKFVVNSSNVTSYFNINISDARKSYDTGYVFRYKITASTKGRYKACGKITLKYKVSFKYTYSAGSNSKRTQTSTDSGTLTLQNYGTNVSQVETVSFVATMGNIISCSYSGYFTGASGYLVAY